MFTYAPPPMLRFYYQPGCAACAAAEPALAEFMRGHPKLAVWKLNLALKDYEIDGTPIRSTPTYALTVGSELVKKHSGVLTGVQLEKFVEVGK